MSKRLAAHLALYHPRSDWTPAMMLATLQAHDAEIARLRALLDQPEPERVPDYLADIVPIFESAHVTHERLTRLYAEAKQRAELARTHGGTFDGKSVIAWEEKAGRYESGLKWNRGRMAEQV
jgi:hypothetical protein